ncbi:hypothetical protein [Pseudonocardia humida]|uniref:Uncharacterized protein n=1 Tax=Pseudonocardia humida TaxID=2800819 RepID=A0ABT0ZWM4_9PSEU|nr:hypothetical protein [Pseudonocardia humida]MCO1655039.1 hypothetical protein [Pseudonocardia humida]
MCIARSAPAVEALPRRTALLGALAGAGLPRSTACSTSRWMDVDGHG